GSSIRAGFWVRVELINPYDIPWGIGGSVKINADKLAFEVNSTTTNFIAYFAPESVNTGWNNELEIPITANVPAHGFAVLTNGFWLTTVQVDTNAYVDKVYVRLNKVRLLQQQNDVNGAHDDSIRDWAIQPDFDQYQIAGNHFVFPSSQVGIP